MIPREFWREVPCGHPPDPVAAVTVEGRVCHCGQFLDDRPVIGHVPPGDLVYCLGCGCHVALPRLTEGESE